MIKYIIKRLLYLLPVLFGVSFIVFTLLYITPGDPAKMMLGEQADAQAITSLREELGLNDPFLVQFGNYIKKIFTKGDIGTSYSTKRPVLTEILEVFPNTVKLAIASTIVAIIIGILFGIISAVKQYSLLDSLITLLALLGISMPMFWVGLLMILLFSVKLGWLPPSGLTSMKSMIMPAIALGAQSIAVLTRMTRSSMLEVIRQDYIRMVRAKGQSEKVVIFGHAFKNALIPIITVIGLQFGSLLGGAIITESVFSIPGLGRLMIESIKNRDFPVVQGCVLFIAVTFSIVNLIVDLLYSYVDPRINTD
ncbi:nickel ABC transporter permease [Tissierella praeacuta]|uniref:nickel ABC transporter permease n=1 Tax=Tissierella praeacuta TaxID=43131 RepID=UPI00333E761B